MVKVLSSVTATYIFVTYCLANVFKDSFMPMLFGTGSFAGLIKLGMLAALIYLAVSKRFKYKLYVQLAGIAGVVVFLFGLIGMASVDLEYMTYPNLMSMDFVTISEMGVLLCLASLTYGYKSAKLAIKKPTALSWQSAQLRIAKGQQVLAHMLAPELPKKQATSLSQRRTRLAS